jgi:hypothetical protein
MVVGAVRQYAMGAEDRYYKMFATKVVDLWKGPGKVE